MTDVTGIIGSTLGAFTPAAAHAQPAATPAPANTLTAPQNQNASSSRLIDNPLAGVVVTQYLDTRGTIVTQVPSAVIVAYLQDGLTSNGESKPAVPPVKTVA